MKIIKYAIGFPLIIATCNNLHAQDSLKHSTFSLAAGFNRIASKDQFQSPYTYRGTNVLLNASYTRYGSKGYHIAELSYSGGEVASIVSPKADSRMIQFNYGYLFNLGTKNANRKLIPSLGFGLQNIVSTINYLPKIQSPKSYTSTAAYLALRGSISYYFNEKNSVTIQAALPVLGLAYRPDFDVEGKAFTKMTYIGKSGLFSADMKYNLKLSSRLSLQAAYRWSYFMFDSPRPVTILQNGFSVGLRRIF